MSHAYPPLVVVGLMSGTSLDGVDATAVRIQLADSPLRILQCETLDNHSQAMPTDLKETLLVLQSQPSVSWVDQAQLQVRLGQLFGETANALKSKLGQQGIVVDLIASHGQTVYHQPPAGEALGYSIQWGEPSIIAEMTQTEVAADFRPTDMAAGGHGAPLVPFADQLLFQHETEGRIVLNIGGIANITALPALSQSGKTPVAFDTGPGNMVIDALMMQFYRKSFDEDGRIAKSGQVHSDLLKTLSQLAYLQEAPPKSTGRELFGRKYVEEVLKHYPDLPTEDVVATLTQFTAVTIAQAIREFILPETSIQQVIAGGGGVKNSALMTALASELALDNIQLSTLESHNIDSQYKEALAFALLGYARKVGIASNLPSCTGASRPRSLGALWQV